jgi:hypothetical protein
MTIWNQATKNQKIKILNSYVGAQKAVSFELAWVDWNKTISYNVDVEYEQTYTYHPFFQP